MRNQSKVIPLDLIQVENEQGCGDASKVEYEICSPEYVECLQPWQGLDQHNLSISLFQDSDEIWKIEVYWGSKHTQGNSIKFEIRSSLAYSRGWSPIKYFTSENHIKSKVFIDFCILQSMRYAETARPILQRDGPEVNWKVYPK